MTTIVYRDSVMVSDSLETDVEDRFKLPCRKIFIGTRYLFGAAGHSSASMRFAKWYKEKVYGSTHRDCPPSRLPDFREDEDFLCMVVKPILNDDDTLISKVVIEIYDKFCVDLIPHTQDYYAIGSGAKCAFPVLDLGHSAEKAVLAACKYDLCTGGDLVSVPITDCLQQENWDTWADPQKYSYKYK